MRPPGVSVEVWRPFALAVILAGALVGATSQGSHADGFTGAGVDPQERASMGSVRAELFYTEAPKGYAHRDVRLRISRRGAVLIDERVPPHPADPAAKHGDARVLPAGYGKTRSVLVRDLDGDREPEVVLELFWGGTHCCFWSRVYRFDPKARRYRMVIHFWGDPPHQLRDLNRDGRPEFVSADGRFASAFTGFAFSYFPVQIWSFRSGRFSDVTRSYPALVKADAASVRRLIESAQAADKRGVGAAWAAEMATVGLINEARSQLDIWAKQGRFSYDDGLPSNLSPKGTDYVSALWRFLRKVGYL